jgi:selenide,water dikinase
VKVLSDLPEQVSDRLLLGGGPDDSGVYRLEDDQLMIQSVDFFTPIVDGPGDYGRIAAANSMSDVFAMGARPRTALNITGVPLEDVGIDRLNEILSASQTSVQSAGAVVMGGHTVKSPEPIFGLAVTGFVDEETLVRNTEASAGDRLFLTKPLGTGILTTAHKKQAIPEEAWLENGVDWMARLNDVGIELATKGYVSTMTDITGYGLLGHAYEMLGESHGMEIRAENLPVLDGVPRLIEDGHVPGGTRDNWDAVRERCDLGENDERTKWLLADAQTSGGLLLAVPGEHEGAVESLLDEQGLVSRPIGRVTDDYEAVIRS